MDKLDEYLDRVCRGIAGPRSLRNHVRQELREHLRDAVADFRASGLTETEAVDRALAEFGTIDDVRSDLAEAHGQRLMALVIDRALEWKEATMNAKWLWLSWTHGVLGGLIATQILFLTFTAIVLTPKVQKILADVGVAGAGEPTITWSVSYLRGLDAMGDQATWIALGAIAALGIFEWRVRGENKPLVRLSALGTTALALGVACVLAAVATAIPIMLTFPAALGRQAVGVG